MSDFASLLSDLKKRTTKTAANESKRPCYSVDRDNKRRIYEKDDVDKEYSNNNNNIQYHKRTRRNETSYTAESSATPRYHNNHRNHHPHDVTLPPPPPPPPPPRDVSELDITISFLCIGAQKAGTTWLDEMLRKIPGVELPIQQKEVHFWDWHRSKGLGWYSRQWKQESTSTSTSSSSLPALHHYYYGEVTPCYAVLPDRDIREIRTLFPNVRLIFLARDLVDRVWSAMLMELRNSMLGLQPGQFQENQHHPPSNDATAVTTTKSRRVWQQLERDADPDKYDDDFFMNRLRHSTHASRGDYATSLKRWLSHFPQEQLLIVPYQQLMDDPRQLLCQCLEHVGVTNAKTLVEEDALSDKDVTRRINVGAIAKPPRASLRRKMEQYLQPMARDFNKLLQELGYKDWRLNEYGGHTK